MLSPESYIQRLKESIYSADKIIQEVSQIQPVSPHSLHELTFDGIPMAKKMLIEDRVKGWYRTTRILIETGSGAKDPNVVDFISRGAATVIDPDFKSMLIKRLKAGQSVLNNIIEAEELKNSLRSSEVTADGIWEIIHPSVIDIAKSRVENGYYADAVECACKLLNTTVRAIVLSETGEETDGASLMRKAFSPRNPLIRIAELSSKSGLDTQQGYMDIYAGVMTGIRNPKAHENETISKDDALRKLVMISLLMYKIDDRRV